MEKQRRGMYLLLQIGINMTRQVGIQITTELLVVPDCNMWWTIVGTKVNVPEYVISSSIVADFVEIIITFDVDEEDQIDITSIKIKEHDILPDILEREGYSSALMTLLYGKIRYHQALHKAEYKDGWADLYV